MSDTDDETLDREINEVLDDCREHGIKASISFAQFMTFCGDSVSYSAYCWLRTFPFADKMSVRDWFELWEEIKPIVESWHQKFYGE